MIRIKREHLNEIYEHAREDYPHEVVGVLVGLDGEVKEVYRAKNINTTRAHDRYEIDSQYLLDVDNDARRRGLDIIGFYHSHPDHPPFPSKEDTERSSPKYSYFIISITSDRILEPKSFVFDDKKFYKEERVITEK